METLRFFVRGQKLKKDPKSPFGALVAGTKNYYEAEFVLDAAWIGYSCLAKYRTEDGHVEYGALIKGKTIIPENILEYSEFYLSVIGKKGSSQLVTNETKVFQTGGKRNG